MLTSYLDSFTEILRNTSFTDAESKSLVSQDGFTQAAEALKKVREKHGTVYLIGNGGSSGIISHTAIDLLNKGHFKAFAVTDSSLLTCLSNDYGFENSFLKVVEKTATDIDALIAVSSSGQSKNIVNAASWAKAQGMFVLTCSGFKPDNPLRTRGHVNLWLNASEYGRVEIGHSLLLHILTDALWTG